MRKLGEVLLPENWAEQKSGTSRQNAFKQWQTDDDNFDVYADVDDIVDDDVDVDTAVDVDDDV